MCEICWGFLECAVSGSTEIFFSEAQGWRSIWIRPELHPALQLVSKAGGCLAKTCESSGSVACPPSSPGCASGTSWARVSPPLGVQLLLTDSSSLKLSHCFLTSFISTTSCGNKLHGLTMCCMKKYFLQLFFKASAYFYLVPDCSALWKPVSNFSLFKFCSSPMMYI